MTSPQRNKRDREQRRGLAAGVYWTIGLLLVVGWAVGAPLAHADAGAFLVDPDAETYLLAALNRERVASGRAPLARDSRLDALARTKARDMAERGYFDHVSPSLGTVFDMLRSQGIDFKWAGENIARVRDVETAHRAFMESAQHRANILSAGYTHVGLGVVRHRGKVYIAQIFMKPRA